jgi:photosystem II stability/assembly factor-like uncharacterized protein
MTDEELVEALRRTLHEQAEAVRPSPGRPPVRGSQPGRVRRPGRRLVLATFATALAAAAAFAIVAANDHPTPAHNVSIAGQASTLPATPTVPKSESAPVSPGSSPASTAAPAVTTPPAPVPTGFQPRSVTFVSAHTGWVLGTAPCRQSSDCTVLARTTDGGSSWTEVARLPMTLNQSTSGGTWVRFADLDTGWIVSSAGSQANELWTTHDGGRSWASDPNPGGSSATVLALEASGGLVHLVDLEPGTGVDRIFTSPIDRYEWTAATATPSFGAGPVPSSEMVLQGSGGWIVNVNRTVVGGLRITSPAGWADWTPPCSDAHGPGYLAAASTSDLYAICTEGVWGSPAAGTTPNSEWLYASTNGGTSFSAVAPVPQTAAGAIIAVAPGTATIVQAADSGLTATFDGGKSWQPVSSMTGISYLGFTTAAQGVAIAQSPRGSSTLLMTHDGGHTWAATTF